MEYEIEAGSDGWMFLTGGQHRVIDLYRTESAFTPEMVKAWVELLRQRGDRLKAIGIEYVHVAAPDKLTLLNRHYSDTLENPDGSPIRQLVAGYEAQLPDFLNVVPFLSQGIDKYPVFWKTDNHWTAWGCFMAYQMICSRLKIPTNTDILNYPFSEKDTVMGFARFDRTLQPEKIRTYQLNRFSRRVYANQVVRYRENLNLDRMARELAAQSMTDDSEEPAVSDSRKATLHELSESLSGEQGAHVVYRNDSASAIDKCIVLFGDSFSDYRSNLLTGMLAETVREVHFIWSDAIDHEYLRQVQPDIVISEGSEASMTVVPVDKGYVSQWADEQLSQLEAAVQRASDEKVTLTPATVPGMRTRRTLLLEEERYQLEPPILVQENDGGMHQELTMLSNPVSLVDLDQSRLYFNGERCLLRSASGRKILDYGVDDEREAYLLHQDYRHLPGKSFLLAPSSGAHCYYHWMLDILPKLGLLERQGVSLDSIDHFLVRKITGQFQLETLAHLGIDRSRIREMVDDQYLHCENLLHVDMHNGINMKMNRFVPLWLKHQFLSTGFQSGVLQAAEQQLEVQQAMAAEEPESATARAVSSGARLRLYIGRPEGTRRGILNEEEIRPIVEAAGFTMVVMEGLSVAEQVSLLSRADALMAPHGGALTNMVFCKPGIPVIEILSRHVYPYYYGLASMCGHRYHAILQDPAKDHGRLVNFRIAQSYADADIQWNTQNESFKVDVDAVKAMMARLPAFA